MLSSWANSVKTYNLSAGKSLPDWLTDRKRRKLAQKDADIRHRIDLVQDLSMPDVSTAVSLSPDGGYLMVAGTYKPRVRCYQLNNLAMKFERCLDAECLQILHLSDAYEKLVLLEEDRWVEFHVKYGRYFRTRIPRQGRDMCYLATQAELYVTGAGSEVYRLSLEQGRFLAPIQTSSQALQCSALNPEHWLLTVGTAEGRVEAWDPRSQTRAAILDVGLHAVDHGSDRESVGVTALAAKDGLVLGVGTAAGLTLLYDLRAAKPLQVRDSHNEQPVKQIHFRQDMGLVASLDCKAVKFWYSETGKPYTAIEPGPDLNAAAFVPGSGLFFMANEAPKVQTHYVPSMGPAPKWCAFLDTITEELEEDTAGPSVYDDYKFVTEAELRALGLEGLVGSTLLRAYMHGYFMDHRLWAKAAALVQPSAAKDLRQRRLKERVQQEREADLLKTKRRTEGRSVNASLAERLAEEAERATEKSAQGKAKTRGKVAGSLLQDERFGALFRDESFAIDEASEEYRLTNPALQRIGRSKEKRRKADEAKEEEAEETAAAKLVAMEDGLGSDVDGSEEEEDSDGSEDSSDDNDQAYKAEMRRAHRELKRDKVLAERRRREEARAQRLKDPNARFRAVAGTSGEAADGADVERMELAARAAQINVKEDQDGLISTRAVGSGVEGTFRMSKPNKSEAKASAVASHVRERRSVRRSAKEITKRLKPLPVGPGGRTQYAKPKRRN